MAKKSESKLKTTAGDLVANRRARHLYEITDTWEAGIELKGSEVKSLREGGGSIVESYIIPRNGELYVTGMLIPPYSKSADACSVGATRDRRLLMHKREIEKISGAVSAKGMTIVPLKLYLNDRGLVKLKVGLAKGKSAHDKRDTIKERDAKRELAREYKLR